ncbi:hypothetical protein [Confluentibacter sediminis]|uniref:hypothetical protein n=1 Tax=Confluentibacter sediminis TaxID=2219045 RepID=UPI000DAEBE10|nr:hypothetical protein [Confluentibacter sediminis]
MNTTLNLSVVPGQPIPESNILNIQKLDAQISFAFNSTSKKPFGPLVQVSFSDTGALQVSAVVFVAASENPNFSGVNKQYVISSSGELELDFFIIYDEPEVRYQIFDAYRIDFIVENPRADLVQIQTYLWDTDPVSSRGTVTTVSQA